MAETLFLRGVGPSRTVGSVGDLTAGAPRLLIAARDQGHLHRREGRSLARGGLRGRLACSGAAAPIAGAPPHGTELTRFSLAVLPSATYLTCCPGRVAGPAARRGGRRD